MSRHAQATEGRREHLRARRRRPRVGDRRRPGAPRRGPASARRMDWRGDSECRVCASAPSSWGRARARAGAGPRDRRAPAGAPRGPPRGPTARGPSSPKRVPAPGGLGAKTLARVDGATRGHPCPGCAPKARLKAYRGSLTPLQRGSQPRAARTGLSRASDQIEVSPSPCRSAKRATVCASARVTTSPFTSFKHHPHRGEPVAAPARRQAGEPALEQRHAPSTARGHRLAGGGPSRPLTGPLQIGQLSGAQYVWHPAGEDGYARPDLPPAQAPSMPARRPR